jgi:hypothetical protein
MRRHQQQQLIEALQCSSSNSNSRLSSCLGMLRS